MSQHNPKVDAYIAKAPEYAQPILTRIRTLFHRACPEITEEMKWNAPHFTHHGLVAGMVAFKQHIRFGFWKGKLLAASDPAFAEMGDSDMSAGKFSKVAELPSDRKLTAMIKAAVKFNAEAAASKSTPAKKSAKAAAKKKKVARTVTVPPDLRAALSKNKKAQATFDAFSYSHKKEYVEWINEAKRDETRQRRLAQAITWLSEGKSRNWKYTNC
ncbi:MAG TPA: YdeI/OmpD-associated family protein [Phycisphaerae bacterium]|nr:YdeI/OmpD-associated family protein [Phycisphaerae bacterium]